MVASILAATQFFGLNHNQELVVNGDFSNGLTGWNLARAAGSLSVVAERGRATSTSTATHGIVQTLPALIIGQQYTFNLAIFKGTSVGNLFVRVSSNSQVNVGDAFQQIFTADGTVSTTFTATATQLYVGVINTPTGSGQYFEIDNVSIRRVV